MTFLAFIKACNANWNWGVDVTEEFRDFFRSWRM